MTNYYTKSINNLRAKLKSPAGVAEDDHVR